MLLVDDEPDLLEVISKGLALLLPSIEVYTSRSVSEAIAQLAARPFGLVVTDLLMPGMDGFELLAYLSCSPRRIPVIVMSGHLTPTSRQRIATFGGLWTFEKPVHLQELADAIGSLFASGPGSVVHGVSVPGFLQLLEIEKKTSTLTVRQDDTVGRLFLNRGRLVDAECGALRGVEAAQRLVGLPNARLEVTNVLASNQRTIDQSVGTLLLEAFRLADEARLASQADGGEAASRHMEMDPAAVAQELEGLAALKGFVGAAVHSPQIGLIAKHGDPSSVDSELCALVNASTGGIGGLLQDRDWGVVREADFMSEGGWLVSFRTIPGAEGLALVTAFCNASGIGLIQLRLREVASALARIQARS